MSEEKYSYKLPDETLPGISFKDHAADLLQFKEFIDNLGITTHNTRIDRYARYFHELAEGTAIDEKRIFKNVNDVRFQSPLDWHLYLLREAHELMWILRGLKKHVPIGVEPKLEKIVSGSDFAALDKNTESRDTQFELRIASYFCQSGCTVDLATDTDIIAITDKHAYFVECKRIAGIRNLKDNLVKAKDQILLRMPKKYEGRHANGIIAADVTKLAFLHNGLTMGQTPDHARDIIQSKLKEIARKASTLQIFTGRPDIIECLLQIHIPSVVMFPSATTTRFSSYSIHNKKLDRKSSSAIREFYNISQAGSISDDREIPSKQLKHRKFIDVPAGSSYSLEQDLITKILSGTTTQNFVPETIVASLKMDDIIHEFTVSDLNTVMRRLAPDRVRKFAENESPNRIELILEMFARRYPYEKES
ncbi:hypothetical protein [Pseudomonas sp. Pdm06]|uniref:hypothetical protein n=1 Tax=Pseudomonas sp. Pdm06 TaxID=1790044 RepID=UPI00177D8BA6|nr:hypothetical protein [Pseudomonas sp. Pdm06]MBD9463923.1 hypothetical protein [Pseudomonas sp. Pdm06]